MRIWRLIFAVGATYILLNLALHTSRQIEWNEYEKCNSFAEKLDGDISDHKECPKINIADGAANIFYLFLGWIPASAYVGLWEIIWRFKNRKIIKEMGKTFTGKWASNIVIGFFILCCSYPFIMLIIFLPYYLYNFLIHFLSSH